MKRTLFFFLLFIGSFMAILHFGGHLLENESPTLNDKAGDPDIHLENTKRYANEHAFDRSMYHLEKAIQTIRIIEEDADVYSGEILEKTIDELLNLKVELATNTLSSDDLNAAIYNALNALTMVELRISESYAETNKLKKAKIAMKYGLLHLEHSMPYSKGSLRKKEVEIYNEIDSMLTSESLYSIDVTFKLSDLITELDSLLKENQFNTLNN